MIDRDAAARVRFVGFDVDGVLTDGGIYLGAAGDGALEFKRYDIQDGLGIHFLREAGLHLAIVTGRVSESVRMRARELGIDDVIQDRHAQKLPALLSLLREREIDPSECAFVGDDFPDLAVLRAVGMPVAVGNAVPEVAAECRVRLTKRGGHGAVREFCELLLRARGDWERIVAAYVAERSRVPAETTA